ncbi:hypothetical protein KFL_012300020 [Klebsormidium nitens]|uniref:SF3 helicase domain-containing protein n=1 Tax=Klebsormidium nitens TaxID=105231 RepID=A0A1Y1IQL6_KLENI|nr:hypothetical protein KFL_012300020 [Klebsormidium nitens]|eukprot:GAQ92973.1 hypothetical protein KFL_012300020 [Klebsormidium nitens]
MSWSYPSTGLVTPLDGLLRVLRDIMHAEAPDGQEAMDHLQCLLGYGLTGHTSSQVLGILYGEGSAGKSVLMALLRLLLGRFYKDMSKDIVVSARGQRAAAKGAASPMEAGLKGILMAGIKETNVTDTLDEGGVKKLTGTEVVTGRPLFKDFITFNAMMLLILCTNHLPQTEKAWSIALQRRLQLVCFPKRYFSINEDGYDSTNPLHGVVDTKLVAGLSDAPHMEQFLVRLVQGAVLWYANGERLLPMPARSIAALDAYQVDNDPFAAFLEWSCDLGPNLFMPTVAGMEAYNNRARLVDGQPAAYTFDLVGTKKFKELMASRAQFRGPAKTNVLGLGTIAGVTERGYRGLALKQPLLVAPGSHPA